MKTTSALTVNSPSAVYNFASPELMGLADELSKIALEVNTTSNNYKRKIAETCAKVKVSDEVWKSAGFKGVGDFANKLFGINKVQLSAWMKVANKFYLNEAFSGVEAINKIPISNLYEIADIEDERIIELIANGQISATSTQQELRKIEATVNAADSDSGKAKVIATYSGSVFFVNPFASPFDEKLRSQSFVNKTANEIEYMVEVILDRHDVLFTKTIKKPGGIEKSFIADNGAFGKYSATKDHRKTKETKSGKKSVTITLEEYERLKSQILESKEGYKTNKADET